jgi:hypothetical protein
MTKILAPKKLRIGKKRYLTFRPTDDILNMISWILDHDPVFETESQVVRTAIVMLFRQKKEQFDKQGKVI